MDLQPMVQGRFRRRREKRGFSDQVVESKLEDLMASRQAADGDGSSSDFASDGFPLHLSQTDRRPTMLVYKRIAPRGLCHTNAKLKGQSNERFNAEFRTEKLRKSRQREEPDLDAPLDDRLSKPRHVAHPFSRSGYNLAQQPVYDMATLSYVQTYMSRARVGDPGQGPAAS